MKPSSIPLSVLNFSLAFERLKPCVLIYFVLIKKKRVAFRILKQNLKYSSSSSKIF